MPITPEGVRFVNEVVRPLCERVRAMKNDLTALKTLWFLGLDAEFAKGDEQVDDKREAEGVSRLIASDITNAINQLLKTAPGESGAWNDDIIQKPCVRQLP